MSLKSSLSALVVSSLALAALLAAPPLRAAEPAQTAPAKLAPAKAAPVQAAPVQAAPAKDPQASRAKGAQAAPMADAKPGGGEWAVLETGVGDIVIALDDTLAPNHAENFRKLVRQGYYDGSPFHRVIEGFMAQGGGHFGPTGQPTDVGYTVPAEISPNAHHVRGTVAAARKGDQVNPSRASSGSQFYICFQPASHLDGQYTVFGSVASGMENVDKISRNGTPGEATVIKRAYLVPAGQVAPQTPAK